MIAASNLGLQTWGFKPGASNLGIQTWGFKPGITVTKNCLEISCSSSAMYFKEEGGGTLHQKKNPPKLYHISNHITSPPPSPFFLTSVEVIFMPMVAYCVCFQNDLLNFAIGTSATQILKYPPIHGEQNLRFGENSQSP